MSKVVIDRLYNSRIGRTRDMRKAEMDIYLPNELPSVDSLRQCNPDAVSVTRTQNGPLIVCYVSVWA